MNIKQWDGDAVFEALVALGRKVKKTGRNHYVHLYLQKHNCAILYKSGGTFNSWPLHFQPASESWDPREFRPLLAAILDIRIERSIEHSDGQLRWIHCTADWQRLARALNLQ